MNTLISMECALNLASLTVLDNRKIAMKPIILICAAIGLSAVALADAPWQGGFGFDVKEGETAELFVSPSAAVTFKFKICAVRPTKVVIIIVDGQKQAPLSSGRCRKISAQGSVVIDNSQKDNGMPAKGLFKYIGVDE